MESPPPRHRLMAGRTASEVPALQPIELDCADEGFAQEMTRWLTHLRAERRLSPKTLEAYARDLRQCLTFLSQHWGGMVTLKGVAALEATDVRAFMAMRRADEIGSRSLMRGLAGARSVRRRVAVLLSCGRYPDGEAKGGWGALPAIRPQKVARSLRKPIQIDA